MRLGGWGGGWGGQEEGKEFHNFISLFFNSYLNCPFGQTSLAVDVIECLLRGGRKSKLLYVS